MDIQGIEGMSKDQIQFELNNGGRFVMFQYCISVILITFRRSSDIYLIRHNQSAWQRGLGFTALSLVAGWWGIPWGPIYTIGSVAKNLGGGVDVTYDVSTALGL